ncbi:MAG TPA: two-component regulator propeller domain-containing protein [Kofleriaceae bacterium]|nr:two-component regulator propeller domain-containing protein [Kofleriaceae bacterium]
MALSLGIAAAATWLFGDSISWAQSGTAGVSGVRSVTIAPRETTLQPRLRFQRLGRERGLPQSTVSAIAQDRTGFIWLGTEDGLARYDGQRFVVFRHEPGDEKSLSAPVVNSILAARDGSLWVATEGGGLDRYRPATSSFERPAHARDVPALTAGTIASLAEGPDGTIWIAAAGDGLLALDPGTGAVRSYAVKQGLPDSVGEVVAARDGSVWAGTVSGVFRLDGQRTRFEQVPGQDGALRGSITALSAGRDGELWIGIEGKGLALYSARTGGVRTFRAEPQNPERLLDDTVRAIHVDRRGRVWVATEKALHILDPASGRFERHPPDSDDPMSLAGSPLAISEDAAGVMWVGTFGGGAALLDPMTSSFSFYKTAGVSAIARSGQDLWIATVEETCRLSGKQSLTGMCWATGLATSLLVDRTGSVWVGTMQSGLLRLDPGSPERWTVYENVPGNAKSLPAGPVLGLHEDRAGNLWIGVVGGGLRRFDRARGEFVRQDAVSSLVYLIEEDPHKDGRLWLGTADRGLIRLDVASGAVKVFAPSPDDLDNKSDNSVVDVAFEGDRSIWLATYGGGLKRLNPATGAFQSFSRPQGLPSGVLCAVLRDGEGKLWASSIAGLAQLDPASGQVRVFTAPDGLQSLEFVQHSRMVGDDGRFYFGGINGFNVFSPADIQVDRSRAPFVLTSIEVLGKSYRGGQQAESTRALELAHDEALVNIEFAALTYSGSSDLRFEYKLEGVSDLWLAARAPSITLSGLDSGDYTLRLRARDRHGVQTEPVALAISVAPVFFLSRWAFSVYGLLLVGSFLGMYRYQKVRIRRLQQAARLAAVEREIELTATVQSWFLPESGTYSSESCDLVGFYRGAEKCSGDWWWYEDVGDGKLWTIVADVTGHGAGPAMLTAAVAMGIWVQKSSTEEELLDRLARVNHQVLLRCKGKATMTMTAVVLDNRSGEATVYSLGGLPALVFKQDGQTRVLGAVGSPIGVAPSLRAGQTPVRLDPGDRMVITTDGIVETALPRGRPLGLRRFAEIARDAASIPLETAATRIVTEVDLARSRERQEDDFTFCMLERRA